VIEEVMNHYGKIFDSDRSDKKARELDLILKREIAHLRPNNADIVETTEVKKMISSYPAHKSPGPDQIQTRLLQCLSNHKSTLKADKSLFNQLSDNHNIFLHWITESSRNLPTINKNLTGLGSYSFRMNSLSTEPQQAGQGKPTFRAHRICKHHHEAQGLC
jgi:hypothetical protein